MPTVNRYQVPGSPAVPRPGVPAMADPSSGSRAWARALDDVAQVTEKIAHARQEEAAAAASARYGSEMASFLDGLEDDTEYDTQLERFEKASLRVRGAHRQGLMGRYGREYDRYTQALLDKGRLAVKQRVRAGNLDVAKASSSEATELYADLAARAPDAETREGFRAAQFANLDRARASGVWTAQQTEQLKDSFDAQMTEAVFRRSVRRNPVDTLEQISDPNSELSRHIPEKRRQELVDIAKGEVEADIAAANGAKKRAKEARKEAQDAAASAAWQMMENGQLTLDAYHEFAPLVDEKTRRILRKSLNAGGRVPGEFVPAYYNGVMTTLATDPEQFRRLNLDPTMLGEKFKDLFEKQVRMRAGVAPEVKQLARYKREYIDRMIGEGWDLGSGADYDAIVAQFSAAVDDLIRVRSQDAPGGIITPAMRDEIFAEAEAGFVDTWGDDEFERSSIPAFEEEAVKERARKALPYERVEPALLQSMQAPGVPDEYVERTVRKMLAINHTGTDVPAYPVVTAEHVSTYWVFLAEQARERERLAAAAAKERAAAEEKEARESAKVLEHKWSKPGERQWPRIGR